MIVTVINWSAIYAPIKEYVKRLWITKRAYKGYCEYISAVRGKPKPYSEFKNFELWQIETGYNAYKHK